MICPNCNHSIREDERLLIGPTKSDGFFSVNHVRHVPAKLFGRSTFKPVEDCKGGWYNRLKIDCI